MTDDPVALNDWYPVADAGTAPAVSTRLLGHPLRIAFAGERSRVTALAPDGGELRELPVTERFGLVWTTLGSPARDVYDFPEASDWPEERARAESCMAESPSLYMRIYHPDSLLSAFVTIAPGLSDEATG